MSEPRPSVGRVVHYKMTESDVQNNSTNGMKVGDVCAAIVTRVFDPTTTTVNLKVFLDATENLWCTSVIQGDDPGQWNWPPRV